MNTDKHRSRIVFVILIFCIIALSSSCSSQEEEDQWQENLDFTINFTYEFSKKTIGSIDKITIFKYNQTDQGFFFEFDDYKVFESADKEFIESLFSSFKKSKIPNNGITCKTGREEVILVHAIDYDEDREGSFQLGACYFKDKKLGRIDPLGSPGLIFTSHEFIAFFEELKIFIK